MKERRVRLHSLVIEFVLGHQLPNVLQPICYVNFLIDRFDVVNLAFVTRPNKSARRVVRVEGWAFTLTRPRGCTSRRFIERESFGVNRG
jgi:hypothetical protein